MQCQHNLGRLSSTILSAQSPYIRIMNTTSDTVKIKNSEIKLRNITEYNIYDIKANTKNKDRTKQLLAEINTDIPEFVKDDVMNLCKEFNDVFD